MTAFLIYLLKVCICSAILFAYYHFALRNKVFHGYNRFYLLAIVPLSTLAPLFKFNFYHATATSKPLLVQALQVIQVDGISENFVVQSSYIRWGWQQFVWLFFISVSLVFTIRLLHMLRAVIVEKRNNPREEIEGVQLIYTKSKRAPFSFFSNIFWQSETPLHTPVGKRILRHELAHVQERHSYDKMFINVVLVFFWANPIFWLLRKELNLIHEFIADKRAVEDGDVHALAEMLLAVSYPQPKYDITNSFFYSPIKRRIIMLTKNNNNVNYISRLLVLPLVLFLLAAFTLKVQNAPADSALGKTTTTIKEKLEALVGVESFTDAPLSEKTSPAFVAEKITVVLEAGHGGQDPGAKSQDGVMEKDLTLALCKMIEAENTDPNIKFIFVRSEDVFVPVKEKPSVVSDNNADLYLAIHVNAQAYSAKDKKSGLEVYLPKEEVAYYNKSVLLSSAIIAAFKNNYSIGVANNPLSRKIGMYTLDKNTVPAVLIEAGYLTTPGDVAYLKTVAAQKTFAQNILKSIATYAAMKNGSLRASPVVTQAVDSPPVMRNLTITRHSDGTANDDDALMVLDGKKYSATELRGKTITAAKARIYEKNNKEMVAMYGDAAKNGVMILEGVKITNSIAEDKVIMNEVVAVGYRESKATKSNTANLAPSKSVVIINGKISTQQAMSALDPTEIKTLQIINAEVGSSENDRIKKLYSITEIFNHVIVITTKKLDLNSDTKEDDKTRQAEYPGGKDSWRKFLMQNLNPMIPTNAGMPAGTYTIVSKVHIDAAGNIISVSSENYVGSAMAEHCAESIKKSGKWTPALKDGKPIASTKLQPITFQVNDY